MDGRRSLADAGGTRGGSLAFFIGLMMMAAGGYMFFQSIRIGTGFSFANPLFSPWGVRVPNGTIFVPFVFGVALIFWRASSIWGWVLALGSLAGLAFAVLQSLQFRMVPMTSFDLAMILVLLFGGVGLFLRSLFPGKGG